MDCSKIVGERSPSLEKVGDGVPRAPAPLHPWKEGQREEEKEGQGKGKEGAHPAAIAETSKVKSCTNPDIQQFDFKLTCG